MDQEVILIDGKTASCSGKGLMGHPKIYLEIESDNHEIVCPYCSQKFISK